MSAIRLYSEKEFHKLLIKNGFEKCQGGTKDHGLWVHTETGRPFSVAAVPEEGIPEYIFDKYIAAIQNLSTLGDGEHVENKAYEAKIDDSHVVLPFPKQAED